MGDDIPTIFPGGLIQSGQIVAGSISVSKISAGSISASKILLDGSVRDGATALIAELEAAKARAAEPAPIVRPKRRTRSEV